MLESGVNPNLTDAEGNDFLHYALIRRNIGDLLPLAIKNGLDVNKLNEKTKLLPLDRALEYGNLKPYEELINEIIKLQHDYIVLDFAPNSIMFTAHRLILAVYRASGRDKTIIKNARGHSIWHGKPNFQIFLENIEKCDKIWP